MSEEVRNAKENIPKALIWSVVLNGLFAYTMTLVLLYTMGDAKAILESSFPIVTIMMEITGSVGATTALITGLMLIGFCVCIATIASASRLTWAWARDGGLPKWFAKVRRFSNACLRTSY